MLIAAIIERGPSPRERGSRPGRGREQGRRRVHPRASGGAACGFAAGVQCRVHPRASGGASSNGISSSDVQGPSPRERGSRFGLAAAGDNFGSIPARAGEPVRTGSPAPTSRVHPRASGGATTISAFDAAKWGPSPRERGSRPDLHPGGRAWWVHPRASGGALLPVWPNRYTLGPSPRERGSPARRVRCGYPRGSIPARAGEPPRCRWRSSRTRVHPRASGGAGGELIWASAQHRVHPRASGGAARRSASQLNSTGPSPRERGSRSALRIAAQLNGSIPARAGEPPAPRRPSPPPGVHPRASGGAVSPGLIESGR